MFRVLNMIRYTVTQLGDLVMVLKLDQNRVSSACLVVSVACDWQTNRYGHQPECPTVVWCQIDELQLDNGEALRYNNNDNDNIMTLGLPHGAIFRPVLAD